MTDAVREHGATQGEIVAMVTTSALEELARIRAFVAGFCSRRASPPLDGESVAALELAVNEAAVNVMKHAYAGRPDGRIDLEARDHGDRVVIRLFHRGKGFRRSDVAPPTFDLTADGGFGIYIIEQSVDEVRYGTDDHGNREIVLTKFKAAGKEKTDETAH
jgi:anti-sigma regulatory factor (Ser/Thr protein kinase)